MTEQLCPQCGGRKVIAVGSHDTKCLACDGKGTIQVEEPKRGAAKPAA